MSQEKREGGLAAPVRHPLNQHDDRFRDEDDLNRELARVYDICHGCRRCVSLCNAFPTLFDLVDESDTLEVDGVAVADYQKVVDQCYLCDLCYLSKCPYVPPHEWNVDFPHLMLRAKIINYEKGNSRLRDRLITSTDLMGKTATAPFVNAMVNAAATNRPLRSLLDKTLEIHEQARLPSYARPTLTARLEQALADEPENPTGVSSDKAVLFTTCYCNYNEPEIGENLYRILRHNNVEVTLMTREHCCGMPKLELGNLKAVDELKNRNIPELYALAKAGWTLLAPVPSCVLMFRQELPLLYPDDEQVVAVGKAFCDPFEFLHRLHRKGQLRTDFKHSLGSVSYHVACHQRVQNIGQKTRQILELIPGTSVKSIERCSGHDGTYGVKKESLAFANKIAAPVVRQVRQQEADHYGSDCPVAGRHIEHNLDGTKAAEHPLALLCLAYGL